MSFEQNNIKIKNLSFYNCLNLFLEELGLDNDCKIELSKGYVEVEADLTLKINAIHKTSTLLNQCSLNELELLKLLSQIFISKYYT